MRLHGWKLCTALAAGLVPLPAGAQRIDQAGTDLPPTTAVEQLPDIKGEAEQQQSPPRAPVRSDRAISPHPHAAGSATAIDQLSGSTAPVYERHHAAPALTPAPYPPPPGLPEEVRRAWMVLALRGEAPSAEALMDYLGPDTMIRLFGQPSLPPSVLSLLSPAP